VNTLAPVTLAGLLAWGTLVGMDLVTFPQALFSRPLIAGAGAGFLLGDPLTGVQVGLVLELFALDVLPVGAARYPDYGAGVVGATVLASGGPIGVTLGLATLYALALAVLGGLTMQLLRNANGRNVRRFAAGLAAGDPGTMATIQYRGLVGDLLRSLALTTIAVLPAIRLAPLLPESGRFSLVSAVAVGCGVAAAVAGAVRSAGRGARLRWLLAGFGLGLLTVVLR